MTRAEIHKLLAEWHSAAKELNKQIEALITITGGVEGPIQEAAWAAIGMLTRLTSERIGCCGDWLDWWWSEHNFGEKPLRARLPGDADWRVITDIEGLAQLVCDDEESAAPKAKAIEATDDLTQLVNDFLSRPMGAVKHTRDLFAHPFEAEQVTRTAMQAAISAIRLQQEDAG